MAAMNPAAVGTFVRRTVSTDGAACECEVTIGKNPATVGAVARRAISDDGAFCEREVAHG